MSSELVYNIIGTVGACLILLGFYRTSIGKWKYKSFWYELDNTVGAVLLIIYQFHLQAYISVVVNVIWAVVAFRGLLSFAERYRSTQQKRGRTS
ncbi:MAG: hypothetical protein JWL85_563 [Candidatus Saccharibacteria bacterium]|nr:hypothetical protein [Candidatus Saccharibacteria bacterium]